ncbi:MAG: VWA domain-containing protein [Thermoplasmata archaeon]
MASSRSDLEERFVGRLAGFGEFLRSQGLPIGSGAELDFARATEMIHVLDRNQFRAASTSTLAKSPEDARSIEALFDQYFASGQEAEPIRSPNSTRGSPPTRTGERGGQPLNGSRKPQEEAKLVEIPIGTYSASAPSSGHGLRPLADREMRGIRRGVRRFRRQVAKLPGRRRVPHRRGTVDLMDTVRHGLRDGGEWVDLRHRRPRNSRAQFVILWDVSGSMRVHENRFFGLVHALESLSRSGRVFAFSTRIEEITADVRRYGYRRAVEAVGHRVDGADGGTRIGQSLQEFADRYGSILRERTTLLVLSDGWDLGEAQIVDAQLRRLSRPGVHIVWVTPYTRRPGFQPSVGAIRVALKHIDALLGPEDFESPWPLRAYHT